MLLFKRKFKSVIKELEKEKKERVSILKIMMMIKFMYVLLRYFFFLKDL